MFQNTAQHFLSFLEFLTLAGIRALYGNLEYVPNHQVWCASQSANSEIHGHDQRSIASD